MALQSIFGIKVNPTGNAVDLGTTDSAFVGVNGEISSGTGDGIYGGGSLHTVDVQGTVVGWDHGIYLGGFLTTGEHVLIETGGFVGSFEVNSYAIIIHAGSSVVDNRGTMRGGSFGYGIGFSEGAAGTTNTLINSGAIEAGYRGVDHGGADTLVVINSGTIKGGAFAYYDLSAGTGQITNTGSMIGEIQFSDGADSYSGAAGHLAGHLLGGGGADTATGGTDNDWFEGGNGADKLTGNSGADTLKGDGGDDILNGGDGNDKLFGGLGNDTLAGGAGNDTFVFDTAPNSSANRDIVKDFSHPADSFQLENAVFAKLGAAGALNPAFFRLGAHAVDGNDHIIYNQATGILSYDANGSAAGGVVQFAVLANKPVLAANDFVVI